MFSLEALIVAVVLGVVVYLVTASLLWAVVLGVVILVLLSGFFYSRRRV